MGQRCTVCMHPERVAIDRIIAMGTGSFRSLAERHGLSLAAVSRHASGHVQVDAMATPAAVAQQVVQAVRQQREQERREIQSIWLKRLDKTYTDAAYAYDQAMADEDGIDAAAKFLMVQARACETGLRADGVLSGGVADRISVNVEQLVVLPNPTRTAEPLTIDVPKPDHQD